MSDRVLMRLTLPLRASRSCEALARPRIPQTSRPTADSARSPSEDMRSASSATRMLIALRLATRSCAWAGGPLLRGACAPAASAVPPPSLPFSSDWALWNMLITALILSLSGEPANARRASPVPGPTRSGAGGTRLPGGARARFSWAPSVRGGPPRTPSSRWTGLPPPCAPLGGPAALPGPLESSSEHPSRGRGFAKPLTAALSASGVEQPSRRPWQPMPTGRGSWSEKLGDSTEGSDRPALCPELPGGLISRVTSSRSSSISTRCLSITSSALARSCSLSWSCSSKLSFAICSCATSAE
mmetsp:Transcript_16915/g.40325  ORF Transcript_16915/g.40325 Transcript_16915/m.40325 type:complete len:300 (+) Transcript_16915:290-1189(+)